MDIVFILIIGATAGFGYFVENVRWLLTIVTPSLVAILFLIACMRLQRPITELKNIKNAKSGKIIKKKRIKVSMLFDKVAQDISNITFEHCEFIGPCMMVVVGDGREWVGNTFNEYAFQEFNNGESYYGAARFFHCKFRYCKFDNLHIITHKEDILHLQAIIVRGP